MRGKINVAEEAKGHAALDPDRNIFDLSPSSFAGPMRVAVRTSSVIDRPFVTPDVFRVYLCTIWNDPRLGFLPMRFGFFPA
jgi:hypothetical protein